FIIYTNATHILHIVFVSKKLLIKSRGTTSIPLLLVKKPESFTQASHPKSMSFPKNSALNTSSILRFISVLKLR
ncbi:hypothetical protein, partial [Vibrio mimicus]|uniref:hypothetical protein n=1 Tax=Vibrio mimicus TaxID=674 RepID=UPI001CA315C8